MTQRTIRQLAEITRLIPVIIALCMPVTLLAKQNTYAKSEVDMELKRVSEHVYYAQADWSAFENLSAFEAAHRRNVYGVYLALEAESMDQ